MDFCLLYATNMRPLLPAKAFTLFIFFIKDLFPVIFLLLLKSNVNLLNSLGGTMLEMFTRL